MQRSFQSLGPIGLCLTSVVLAVACGDDDDAVSCQTSGGGQSGSSTLPTGIVSACTDMTIATWINMTANDLFNRILDFGFNTSVFMHLTPHNQNNNLQFAIVPPGGSAQVVQDPAGRGLNAWHHVAAVTDGTTARLYADGAPIGTQTFTANPAVMGATPLNYLGKSQFAADPNYRGRIDEMIISCRAFTAGEIKMLAQ